MLKRLDLKKVICEISHKNSTLWTFARQILKNPILVPPWRPLVLYFDCGSQTGIALLRSTRNWRTSKTHARKLVTLDQFSRLRFPRGRAFVGSQTDCSHLLGIWLARKWLVAAWICVRSTTSLSDTRYRYRLEVARSFRQSQLFVVAPWNWRRPSKLWSKFESLPVKCYWCHGLLVVNFFFTTLRDLSSD